MSSGIGAWHSTMALFYSLEQVVSFEEGAFPENMLFQGLLIAEYSHPKEKYRPGFTARNWEERAS
jgi:hypothetical protein